jgi:2-polyprenyl-6-hydroxyphenyl methylase / 3-demethylubiquinone-9 3-methyltransferase
MPVDNELYNHLSNTWWNENEALGILRSWLGPVRSGYFQKILIEERKLDPQGKTVLDVGCGGGLLAEDFARLNCRVTGIDPSEASLAVARQHAQQAGLAMTYQVGVGEHLPCADASFDIVICCDVLEHVNSVEQVIKEIARVLKPGGIFFYDTINRTMFTWLVHIKIIQEWKLTRFMPANLHKWNQFVKPRELLQCMQKYHLHNQDMKGMSPHTHPLHTLNMFLQQKRGKIALGEMGKRMQFRASRDLSGSYMGYAVKGG